AYKNADFQPNRLFCMIDDRFGEVLVAAGSKTIIDVQSSYVPSINWSDSSTDVVSLLHAANEEQDDYHVSYRVRGSRNYLARQAFLRSYKFCVEETFKDKLRRSVRRLNEESFEEIVKESLRKLMRATKAVVNRCHYEIFVARKTKQANLLPGSCFSQKPVASQHVLTYYNF
ncbi:hypothetical protein KI387_004666, partial [Taxus chinensis]